MPREFTITEGQLYELLDMATKLAVLIDEVDEYAKHVPGLNVPDHLRIADNERAVEEDMRRQIALR